MLRSLIWWRTTQGGNPFESKLPAQIGVPTSSVRQQTLIGEMLRRLDDKIASNNRVNALGMSLLLAKYSSAEGAEGVNFEDAARGGGATPSTKKPELWGQGVLWATPTDVTALDGVWLDRTERTISPVGLDSISSPLYPVGSIAMTSRATIGACALLGEPMAVNQGFIVLQPKQDSRRHWLYCQLFDRVEELKAWANGATFLELPKKIFRQLPVDLGANPIWTSCAICDTTSGAAARSSARTGISPPPATSPAADVGQNTVKDAEKAVEEVSLMSSHTGEDAGSSSSSIDGRARLAVHARSGGRAGLGSGADTRGTLDRALRTGTPTYRGVSAHRDGGADFAVAGCDQNHRLTQSCATGIAASPSSTTTAVSAPRDPLLWRPGAEQLS